MEFFFKSLLYHIFYFENHTEKSLHVCIILSSPVIPITKEKTKLETLVILLKIC